MHVKPIKGIELNGNFKLIKHGHTYIAKRLTDIAKDISRADEQYVGKIEEQQANKHIAKDVRKIYEEEKQQKINKEKYEEEKRQEEKKHEEEKKIEKESYWKNLVLEVEGDKYTADNAFKLMGIIIKDVYGFRWEHYHQDIPFDITTMTLQQETDHTGQIKMLLNGHEITVASFDDSGKVIQNNKFEEDIVNATVDVGPYKVIQKKTEETKELTWPDALQYNAVKVITTKGGTLFRALDVKNDIVEKDDFIANATDTANTIKESIEKIAKDFGVPVEQLVLVDNCNYIVTTDGTYMGILDQSGNILADRSEIVVNDIIHEIATEIGAREKDLMYEPIYDGAIGEKPKFGSIWSRIPHRKIADITDIEKKEYAMEEVREGSFYGYYTKYGDTEAQIVTKDTVYIAQQHFDPGTGEDVPKWETYKIGDQFPTGDEVTKEFIEHEIAIADGFDSFCVNDLPEDFVRITQEDYEHYGFEGENPYEPADWDWDESIPKEYENENPEVSDDYEEESDVSDSAWA